MLIDEIHVENVSTIQGCITHNIDIWILKLKPWLVEEGIYGHNQFNALIHKCSQRGTETRSLVTL